MEQLEHQHLIFIDESGVNMKLHRKYARAIGGARVKAPVPYVTRVQLPRDRFIPSLV